MKPEIDIYFSDHFHVRPSVIERYGAFNISLLADLPLFVDPFLLFNSRKPAYRKLHDAFGTAQWQGNVYDVMKELLEIRKAARN